jgi:hypothetical protein
MWGEGGAQVVATHIAKRSNGRKSRNKKTGENRRDEDQSDQKEKKRKEKKRKRKKSISGNAIIFSLFNLSPPFLLVSMYNLIDRQRIKEIGR